MFCPRKTIQTNVEIVKYDPVDKHNSLGINWSPTNNIIIAIGNQLPLWQGCAQYRKWNNRLTTHANWSRWTWYRVDVHVLTRIYCQKQIKVNVKSKRITVQYVWLWYQHLLWRLTIKKTTTYQIGCMIFWLIFRSYFVAFLGESKLINRPKCKPISIQCVRC